MRKYQQFFEEMIQHNKDLFDKFRQVHDKYMEDPKKYQQEFNQIGADIQDLIRRYDNMLCSHSQNSGFGKFSTNLSEKFYEQIRTVFPKIDAIGLEV